MDESVFTEVISSDDDETRLEINYNDMTDLLTVLINGEEIFVGNWSTNFFHIFKRCVEIWSME